MKRATKYWIRLGLLLCLLWTGACFFYVKEITDPGLSSTQGADGIVVLTGTPARLKLGFDLLKEGAGKRILISGVNRSVSKEELRIAMKESDQLMNCCVDLGRLAKDTVGNAYEASLWAEEHDFKDLIIVTSAYHMPRSLIEIKRQIPDMTLHAYAPQGDAAELQNWWRRPKVIYVLAAEFNKYIVSLIRARIEALIMDGADT
ncbi:MAG: YdcF family protein [Sneathiella sp.]